MSESKELRSVDAIQTEYTQLCTKAGHLQYQINALSKDLELVNKTLTDLNLEGAAAFKRESDKKEQEKKAAAGQGQGPGPSLAQQAAAGQGPNPALAQQAAEGEKASE
jgi:hypothetical protein